MASLAVPVDPSLAEVRQALVFFIQIAYFSCRGNNIIFIVGIGVNRILAFARHDVGELRFKKQKRDTRSARRKTGQHVASLD